MNHNDNNNKNDNNCNVTDNHYFRNNNNNNSSDNNAVSTNNNSSTSTNNSSISTNNNSSNSSNQTTQQVQPATYNNNSNNSNPRSKKSGFACPVCKKTFVSKSYLRLSHLPTHNCVTLQCKHCNRTFKSEDKLLKHIVIHKKYGKQINFRNLCKVCNKLCSNQTELASHRRNEHPEWETTRFKCDVCGKSYQQKAGLKVHKLTHTGTNKFIHLLFFCLCVCVSVYAYCVHALRYETHCFCCSFVF